MKELMTVEHDSQADAIYIYISSKPYAFGRNLDNERRIDFASDYTPVGVELLNVSMGVNVDDLPYSNDIGALLDEIGIKIIALTYARRLDFPASPSQTLHKWLLTSDHTEETTWTSTSLSSATMPM